MTSLFFFTEMSKDSAKPDSELIQYKSSKSEAMKFKEKKYAVGLSKVRHAFTVFLKKEMPLVL